MKRDEAIRTIKAAGRTRSLIFREHAFDEMANDQEYPASVAAALAAAGSFTKQDNGLWRVHGQGLTVIVKMTDAGDVIVWTVFIS